MVVFLLTFSIYCCILKVQSELLMKKLIVCPHLGTLPKIFSNICVDIFKSHDIIQSEQTFRPQFKEAIIMTTTTIFTSLFILAFGALLVIGYMHEEKVIAFEDKLARYIAATVIYLRRRKAPAQRAAAKPAQTARLYRDNTRRAEQSRDKAA